MGNSVEYLALRQIQRVKKDFCNELKCYLDLSQEEDRQLLSKANWMINYRDFDSLIRMLCSFKNGPKRLPTNKYAGDVKGSWVDSAHGSYWSSGPNDERGHFRWDCGKRFTLSNKTILNLEHFITKHNFREL